MVGFCEHGNEPSNSLEGRQFLERLRNKALPHGAVG
jgi:hypothetical protein